MDQTTALNILKSGRNVFLTGQAGSGKTYVINQYVKWLWGCGVQVAITASTGIAATHIGGVTIHSRSGIGIKNSLNDHDMELLQQKEHLHTTINKAKILILDEISMLSANTIDMVERVVKMIRRDGRPFGGMQVIFVGDFFQLPPIVPLNPDGTESTKRFAFASHAWKTLDLATCYLHTQHRQEEGDFSTVLNELRQGAVSPKSLALLKTRIKKTLRHKDPVKLYTHNIDVDRINRNMLDAINEPLYEFSSRGSGDKKIVATLKKSLVAPHILMLKKDAQVIFLKNNPQKGYRNGTTGKVLSFHEYDGYPMVKLPNGAIIKVEPEVWSIENAHEIVASVKQIPLKLAWAITVHKSQGMTLTAAEIDLSRVFEPGQAYVALSRIKSLDGLCLLGINEQGLRAHPLVLRGDTYFAAQSQLIDEQYGGFTKEQRVTLHTHFIEVLGGVYHDGIVEHKKAVAHSPKKKGGKKTEKGASLEATLVFVKEGKILEEIAEIRGLATSTILTHIFGIHKLYPEVSLKQFKPKKELVTKVKHAIAELKDQEENLDAQGRVTMKSIYNFLEKKVGYPEIKQALLFV